MCVAERRFTSFRSARFSRHYIVSRSLGSGARPLFFYINILCCRYAVRYLCIDKIDARARSRAKRGDPTKPSERETIISALTAADARQATRCGASRSTT